MCAATLFVLIYIALSCIQYQNNAWIQKIKTGTISDAMVKQQIARPIFHDAAFYREIAKKLPYYPHQPEQMDELFKMAIRKAPADHQTYLLFSYYLVSKGCCQDQVNSLLTAAEERCPTCVEIQQLAANHYLELGKWTYAVPHFQRALEFNPDLAQKTYLLLEQNGYELSALEEITPLKSGPLLQLGAYLAAKKDAGKSSLDRILQKLEHISLNPEERVRLGALELHAGRFAMAKEQANQAAAFEETRTSALQLLTDIAWRLQEWTELEKLSSQLESFQLQSGNPDQAAQTALLAAARLMPAENSAVTKKRLLRILDAYPQYAPGYFQMANFVQAESSQLALLYLRKAVEHDPDNPEFLYRLAQQCLTESQIGEAEEIFQKLTKVPEWQEKAYQGLVQCKAARGEAK
jgi:tetratricopeptide (TPR) repeat protein